MANGGNGSSNGNSGGMLNRSRLLVLSTSALTLAALVGGLTSGVISYLQDQRGRDARARLEDELRTETQQARKDMLDRLRDEQSQRFTAVWQAIAEINRQHERIDALMREKVDERTRAEMLQTLQRALDRIEGRLDRQERELYQRPGGPR